jgi:hypothetical protein
MVSLALKWQGGRRLTQRQAHVRVTPYTTIVSLLQISNILVTNSIALAPAASWWMMFGSSTPALQKLVVRLVSQCVSSSGCECNWSTFALLHTKVHNRLMHKKLNKLVYLNYNLRLRLKEVSGPSRDEGDFIVHLAHLSFYASIIRFGNGLNMVDLTKNQFWMRMMMTATSLSRLILSVIT